jgi:FkbM family methyltransferase
MRNLAVLLNELGWLRRYREKRAQAGPLKMRLSYVRNDIRRRTLKDWRPAYVVPGGDADYLTYVPAPVDVMAGYRLLKPFVSPFLLKTFLAPGDVFIDIGANIGDWTLPAARLVGTQGRVLSVEPVPRMAEALRKSAWVNRFTQVQVFDCALSNRVGEADFSMERENSGGSRLDDMQDGPGRNFSRIKVKVRTLDEMVDAENLSAIALIKIDVEGFEADVLQGAVRTLNKFSPPLHLETGHETEDKRRIIADSLAGAGYELAGIVCADGVVEAPLRDYAAQSGLFTDLGMANIFALPAMSR